MGCVCCSCAQNVETEKELNAVVTNNATKGDKPAPHNKADIAKAVENECLIYYLEHMWDGLIPSVDHKPLIEGQDDEDADEKTVALEMNKRMILSKEVCKLGEQKQRGEEESEKLGKKQLCLFKDVSEQPIAGFCGLIVTPESSNYNEKKEQYATSSYPKEDMSPGLIVYPVKSENESDIILALSYAEKKGMKVMIRSGGHQYSGLSSGNNKCLIIDMANYNDVNVDASSGIMTIGPCVDLARVGEKILQKDGLSIPFGDCAGVNIGGHVQSGGYGNFLRSYGLCCDYCIGFTIVTYDGKIHKISKPDGESKYDVYTASGDNIDNNFDIYWAVLGGNPASFGILTELEFQCIFDKDHPNSSGLMFSCLYCDDLLKEMIGEIENLLNNPNLPSDYDFMITTGNGPFPFGFGGIIFQGIYGNVNGVKEEYNSSWFDKFYKIADKYYPEILIFKTYDGKQNNLSHMMVNNILIPPGQKREYPYPYQRSLRGAPNVFKHEWVNSYVNEVEGILSASGWWKGLRTVTQIMIAGGAGKTNDPNSKFTSLPNRDIIVGFTFDIFYGDNDGKEIAIKKRNNMSNKWVGSNCMFSNEDRRYTWGTWGNTDINQVWKYYYNPNRDKRYSTLRRIKFQCDPNNLCSNSFTIPPKTDNDNDDDNDQDVIVILGD